MNIHENLNKEQLKVINSPKGINLVVSGPGTGKTTTIKHYILELIMNQGVDPERILAVTFTNKAASQMKERIGEAVEKTPSISTIHSFAANVMRRYPPANYTSSFQIVGDREEFFLVSNLIKELGIKEHPSYVMEKMTLARNRRDKTILKKENLEEFYARYMKSLMKRNMVDYDGLLTWCCFVFEKNQEALEYYQDKYRYVMVDEFQDISSIQDKILEFLVDKNRNYLVVGDFDQSIYRFRGSDYKIMINLNKKYPELKTFFLEENYRSKGNILKAANHLISKNTNRKDKKLWNDFEKGDKVTVLPYSTAYQEAKEVGKLILNQVKKGKDFSDFAILYRVHILSRVFEEVFSTMQIPYQIIGGVGFFKRKEIKETLDFFKIITNPDDQDALKDIIVNTSRYQGIPDYGKRYREILTSEFIDEKADFLKSIPDKIRDFSKESTLVELYEYILNISGYLNFLKKDKSMRGEKKVESVEDLKSVFASFDKKEKSVSDFLNFVDETHESKEDSSKVKLMTAHSSKGLEFDTVFVVGVEEGMFPHYSNKDDIEDIEEERRLFYVAITRAKNKLYLTYPNTRIFKGKEKKIQESEFIDETKESLFKDLFGKKTTSKRDSHARNIYRGTSPGKVKKDQIEIGSRVVHGQHGEGTITKIAESHDQTEVEIDFDKGGKMTRVLEFTDLRLK